jgi:imidazoleglycerol-phosphate dehydratase
MDSSSKNKVSSHMQGREASVTRQTKETNITLTICLDGKGEYDINSGIGFLDHMLSHVAVHGLFDLTLRATGDLHVDVHHTIEDIAITLGQAFDQALGDRSGIVRIASATVPMDETLAEIAVDLSGRPYSVIQVDWHAHQVGGIPVTLFPHFLESFATSARANLHARVFYGRDDHHKAEALFKALGRALDTATQIDPRRVGAVPSTKGTLSK